MCTDLSDVLHKYSLAGENLVWPTTQKGEGGVSVTVGQRAPQQVLYHRDVFVLV